MGITKVAVLMGGPSSEHDVSLKSGTQVISALDKAKYSITPIIISRNKHWKFLPENFSGACHDSTHGEDLSFGEAMDRITATDRPDVVFLALHGAWGEDGHIQAILDSCNLKYTGSGVLSSALAMDKAQSAVIFNHHGLPYPQTASINYREWESSRDATLERILKTVPLPIIVKPNNGGSSIGVSLVDDMEKLPSALETSFQADSTVLVQPFLRGAEVSCGVLDSLDGPPLVLPPTQIVPLNAPMFDYDAKYTPGSTREITPAPISEENTKEVQRLALQAHQVLGCRGASRTDMIITDNKIYVLETNTLPGLTPTSLFPQAAAVAGIQFPALLDRLVLSALNGSK